MTLLHLVTLFRNWRTTLMGVGAIVAALGDLITQLATQEWDTTRLGTDLTGLFTGIGLLFARDSAVSEQEHQEVSARIDTNTANISQVTQAVEAGR